MTALLVFAFWACAVIACVLWVQLGHDPKPRRHLLDRWRGCR